MYTYTEHKPELAKRITDSLDSNNVEKVEIRKRRVVRKAKKWSLPLFKHHSSFILSFKRILMIFRLARTKSRKALHIENHKKHKANINKIRLDAANTLMASRRITTNNKSLMYNNHPLSMIDIAFSKKTSNKI